MKKLALMTTAAAVLFSVPAMAGHDARYHESDARYDDTYKLRVQNDPTMNVQTQTRTRTEIRPSTRQEYTLETGGRIIVQGEAVYLVTDGGMKYPAPHGDYYTREGFVVVSDDGKWLRTEGPMETVYVDVDADNDGMIDTVRTY